MVGLVCLILILLSFELYILSETDYQKIVSIQAKKDNQASDFVKLVNDIKRYNKTLAQINSFNKKEIYLNQILQTVVNVPRPAGVHLMNFSMTRDDKGTIKGGISGISDTRDNLLLFKRNIESVEQIKNPYFSPESWTKPQNTNFSLMFEI